MNKEITEVVECIRGGRKLPQKYKKFTNKVEIDSNGL